MERRYTDLRAVSACRRFVVLFAVTGAVAMAYLYNWAAPASAWPATGCAASVWNSPGSGHYSQVVVKQPNSCNDLNLNVTGAAYFTGCWYAHYCAPSGVYCIPGNVFNVLWKNFTFGYQAQVYDNTSNGEATRLVF